MSPLTIPQKNTKHCIVSGKEFTGGGFCLKDGDISMEACPSFDAFRSGGIMALVERLIEKKTFHQSCATAKLNLAIAEALEDKRIELHELADMITKINELKSMLDDIVLMGMEHVDISSVVGEFDEEVVICRGQKGCACSLIPESASACVACRHGATAPKQLYSDIVNKRQIRELKKADKFPAMF